MQTKPNINRIFNDLAKNYDKLNNIISLGLHLNIKKQAVKNVPLKDDFKVLDICTGTGDVAIYIAKNITKNGKVTGIDFSEPMLAIAKRKASNLKNIEFLNADAMALPFEDNEFDACFISFGLRNLPDYKQALLEMKRVTKNGGFVVNLDTGKPQGFLKFFYQIYFFKIMPALGRFFHGNASPYEYLAKSSKSFPSSKELVSMFEELGLKEVKSVNFLFGAISQQIGEV
ncbi:MAG: bifunctional demethylmenaquinone methyltransferase/2-methoxy-6-polyprenyl-1,4-benzoquinol methylase UbiE [Candidatus Gastranaerophilales bacterium]|nr:bifunctional demethylmenaquinone methyltransferase/2-methoxy-6-polyprenyl-1,4-benzoquinol methylase UbiE [Candidatus Gastranaerophilales bacterium]